MDNLLSVIIVLLLIIVLITIYIIIKIMRMSDSPNSEELDAFKKEILASQQQLKSDLLATLQALNSTSNDAISRLGTSNVEALKSLGLNLKDAQEQSARLQEEKLALLKAGFEEQMQQFKERVANQEQKLQERLTAFEKMNSSHNDNMRTSMGDNLGALKEETNTRMREIRVGLDDKLRSMNENLTSTMNVLRASQAAELQIFNKGTNDQMTALTNRLDTLTKSNEEKLEKLRNVVSDSLVTLQKQNDAKLEDIRVTVGEKLQTTLEQRLANSFNVVNQQLESVFKGLGEMRSLASEVGGLKKVLGNVKLRGNLGEVQLGAIMEQLLAPEQYATNVITVPGSSKRVEFAVKLPGKDEGIVYLPIDSKFPADTYNKLVEAKETADREAIKNAQKALRDRVLAEAKDISEKYVRAPYTTDFAIMFLPFEGLYSEVLSLDIFNELQNKYHIMVAGPNTMAAMLNSLRMGFKTLALQKRSGEISEVLEAVKTEFGKFGDCLKKMKGHLESTSKDLDELMGARTKKINTKLRSFDTMELGEAENILQISNDPLDADGDGE